MIKASYVRMAMQSAAARYIKFPSPEFEEYVAKWLNSIVLQKLTKVFEFTS